MRKTTKILIFTLSVLFAIYVLASVIKNIAVVSNNTERYYEHVDDTSRKLRVIGRIKLQLFDEKIPKYNSNLVNSYFNDDIFTVTAIARMKDLTYIEYKIRLNNLKEIEAAKGAFVQQGKYNFDTINVVVYDSSSVSITGKDQINARLNRKKQKDFFSTESLNINASDETITELKMYNGVGYR